MIQKNHVSSATTKAPKVTVIVTVLNEAKTIEKLVGAFAQQTLLPDEVIITDGGSTDQTVDLIERAIVRFPHLNLRVLLAKGNRSVGRNSAIAAAKNEWIAITDAGCIPHPNWLAELVAQAKKAAAQTAHFVIAGYYDAEPLTPFEEAVIPYVFVMPDKVNPESFLPATRSMLLPKTVWEKFGKFDERLNDNEDYAFSHKILDQKIPIYFAANAKVQWLPRTDLRQFSWMVFRFARGDVVAGIWRPKVVFLFARYIVGLGMVAALIRVNANSLALMLIAGGLGLYLSWAVAKNARYTPRGWYWLPVLQLVADGAVMAGSLAGLVKKYVPRV